MLEEYYDEYWSKRFLKYSILGFPNLAKSFICEFQ